MLRDTNIPVKYLLGKIKPEIIVVSAYAVLIVYFHDFAHIEHMSIPISIPAILGTTISLILGFRINQSYDRWWEARKIWGSIVNDSRTVVRQSLTFVKDENQPEEVKKWQWQLAKNQIIFVFALGRSLRGLKPLMRLDNYLSEEEKEELLKQSNVPNAVLSKQAELLKQAIANNWITGYEVIQVDSTLTALTNSMGMAERIKTTIFPVTYTLIVEFLLYLFVMLLPLGMTDYFGYLVAPLMILITIPFFLLEKTAIHLQSPFNNNKTDIPVNAIAKTIEMNINQMMGRDFTMRDNSENGPFYIM